MLTLAAPGTGGSLDANTSITIDTTAPTVSGRSVRTRTAPTRPAHRHPCPGRLQRAVNVTGTPSAALTSGATRRLRVGLGHLDAHLHLHRPVGRHRDAPRCLIDQRARRRDDPRRRRQRRHPDGRRRAGHTRRAREREEPSHRHHQPDRDDHRPRRTARPTTRRAFPRASAGSSADTGGSGVAAVAVAIQDGSGNYWNGATFGSASILFDPAGGTTAAWTYSTATLLSQLADGHTYTITTRATRPRGATSRRPRAPSRSTSQLRHRRT